MTSREFGRLFDRVRAARVSKLIDSIVRAMLAVALLVLISGCSVTGGSGIGGTIDDGGFLDRAVNGDRRRVKADIEVPAGDSYTLHVTGGGGANNATSINTGGGDGQDGR